MKRLHFDLSFDLPEEVEQLVEEGHRVYEARHGVVCDFEQFWIVSRDDSGAVTGVLSAYTAYAEIYIDDLWVAEHHRREGLGTALIAALEERFRHQGYDNINLVTNEFQAVAFYKKCGFEVEFVRHNRRHRALTKTFFIKYLDGDEPMRGVLNPGDSDAG